LLSIRLKTDLKDAKLEVYNSLSQIVFTKSSLYGKQFSFDNLKFSSGLYYYRLTEGNKIFAEGKLQKIHIQ
jgi:hypothetical protein